MLVTKQIEIDLGHRVTNHKSKCSSLHGHRYKIEVGVDDKVVDKKGTSDEGMVIDFGDLKTIMMHKIDEGYDHGFILWEGDPMVPYFEADPSTKFIKVEFIPTAENLAQHWYFLVKEPLEEVGIKINHVTVWETPTSTATFKE